MMKYFSSILVSILFAMPVLTMAAASTSVPFLGTTTSSVISPAALNGVQTALAILSLTATSTFKNGINLTNNGCFAVSGVCINGGGTIGPGTTGQVAYYNATNQAVGTSTLFIAPNSQVGVGSTTPWGLLSIGVPDNSPTPQFAIASSSKVSFFVGPTGAVSIGTSTNTGNRSLLITSDENTATPVMQLRNWNSGNAANANFFVTNDAGGGFNEIVYGSGFSTSSLKTPNSGHFVTSGALANGMVLGTSGATAPLIFVQGGANTEIMRLFNGNLGIASTSPQSLLSIGGGNITQTSGSFSATNYADFTNVPAGMVISGKYAYIAESVAASGLEIFDLSTSTPFLISTLATANAPIGKPALAGNYLYVGENNNATTVQIIDVSNVKAPVIVSTINTGQSARSIAVSGRYLYISAGAKVFTYDISNPLNPQQLGQITLANVSAAFAMAIQGPYMYLAESTTTAATAGFQILDVSNPSTPTLLSSFPIANPGRAVVVQGRYAYVGESVAASGIQVLDVSNPISPTLVSTFATNGTIGASFGAEIVLAGNYLYVHGSGATNNVQIIGTSNPAALVSVAATTSNVSAIGRGLSLVGKYLYDAYGNAPQGFAVFDVSGANLPSATIGALSTDILYVTNSATFGGNIFSNGSINAGLEGILSRGALSVFIASTTATTPTAATFQGGGVAVGTSTALWPMTLANIATTSTGSQYPQLALLDNGTNKDVWTLRNVSGNLYIATSSQIAATSTVAAIQIDPNGQTLFLDNNVGIGTTTPQKLFSIANTTGVSSVFEITNASGAATVGPTETFYKLSTSSAAGDLLGAFEFDGNSDTKVRATFGRIRAFDTDPTNASKDSSLSFETRNNNLLQQSLIITSGNVGVGTTTAWGLLSIASQANGGNTPLFVIATSTPTATSTAFMVAPSTHLIASSTSPVLSACGTAPSMLGSDSWGTVTGGAASNGCVVTFQVAYSATPVCVVSAQTGSVVNTFSYSVSATAITVTETGLGTGKFDYICHGVSGTQ